MNHRPTLQRCKEIGWLRRSVERSYAYYPPCPSRVIAHPIRDTCDAAHTVRPTPPVTSQPQPGRNDALQMALLRDLERKRCGESGISCRMLQKDDSLPWRDLLH